MPLLMDDEVLISDRVEISGGCPTTWELKAEFLGEMWDVIVS